MASRPQPASALISSSSGFFPSALTRLCAEMKDGRDQRKYRIIDFLHEKGVDISLAEVEELAGGDVLGVSAGGADCLNAGTGIRFFPLDALVFIGVQIELNRMLLWLCWGWMLTGCWESKSGQLEEKFLYRHTIASMASRPQPASALISSSSGLSSSLI